MSVNPATWAGDWQHRLRSRLRGLGFESTMQFLDQNPGVPYVDIAASLGDDIAAMQLIKMQVQEARGEKSYRHLSMDSLARELVANLPEGWGRYPASEFPVDLRAGWEVLMAENSRPLTDALKSQRIEFQTSSARAFWITIISGSDLYTRPRADAVWTALVTTPPPIGWVPSGANDPLIADAFEVGWPIREA